MNWSTSRAPFICSYFLSYVVLSVKLNQTTVTASPLRGFSKASKPTIQVHLTSIKGAGNAHLSKQWWKTKHSKCPVNAKDVLIREPSPGQRSDRKLMSEDPEGQV